MAKSVGPYPPPLAPFLRRLHDEGLTVFEAMYLERQGIPEEELRKRPLWPRIAELIAVRVGELRWFVENDLKARITELEAAGDVRREAERWRKSEKEAELAAWQKQLGATFWNRPFAWQGKRLGERVSERRSDGSRLRDELQPHWRAKGFQGRLRWTDRELDAARLRVEADRIEAGEPLGTRISWAELRRQGPLPA
jgi:hypothetical protein